MATGLFGKLPAKRDFVALAAPRRFLELWEGWLQPGMATSQLRLGSAWSAAYNRAPLWRFWLGSSFAGEPVLGVFGPSVDGVGRAFPLTIFDMDRNLEPPEIEPNDAWCDSAETLLLDALEPMTSYEDLGARTRSLAPPRVGPGTGDLGGFGELPDEGEIARGVGAEFALAFQGMRRLAHRRAMAGQSCWWTVGGEGVEAIAFSCGGLPRPARFADFLTGDFSARPVEERAS